MPNPVFKPLSERRGQEFNPYISKLANATTEQSLRVWAGPQLSKVKGNWKQLWEQKPQRLILEIGCYRGESLATLAAANPELAFIGMDITFKRAYLSAERVHPFSNARIIMANALNLPLLFSEGELDGVLVFFPDPWEKKQRQLKKRLLDENFCRLLYKLLAPGANFWFKTDSNSYYEQVSAGIHSAGFQQGAEGLWNSSEMQTPFERRFRRQNKPVFEGRWTKG